MFDIFERISKYAEILHASFLPSMFLSEQEVSLCNYNTIYDKFCLDFLSKFKERSHGTLFISDQFAAVSFSAYDFRSRYINIFDLKYRFTDRIRLDKSACGILYAVDIADYLGIYI